MTVTLKGFLADTWWYAMTSRLSDEDFKRLTELRATQGYSAAQVVVGIPPETTPDNPNAASPAGPAWTWSGEFNDQYLQFARDRILKMNESGLAAIIYGAWGQQIRWLGIEPMIAWWQKVIDFTSDLEVIYCLTGESNHHLGVGDQNIFRLKWSNAYRMGEQLRTRPGFRRIAHRLFQRSKIQENRRQAWSQVLEQLTKLTEIPFVIHPSPGETGFDCVENPHLLAANTGQTGHSEASRGQLYQLPLQHYATHDIIDRGFINLEPWYEGILNGFYGPDQLYAYWVSILAGADSYCYGAHGIWNIGDGGFLNHWGSQTFEQAIALDTPRLIGLSHQLIKLHLGQPGKVNLVEDNEELISITRKLTSVVFTYIPDIKRISWLPAGRIWLPMEGRFADDPPRNGQVVIISGSG